MLFLFILNNNPASYPKDEKQKQKEAFSNIRKPLFVGR